MNTPPSIRGIARLLEDLADSLTGDDIGVDAILEALHERGIAMALLFFAAPMALPVPVPPGVSTVLGTPLLFLTFQQARGAHKIWLPARLRQKTFSGPKLKNIIHAVIPWVKRIEIVVKPRLGLITQDGFSRFFGTLGVLMAVAICLPIPLANTIPSFGIVLMSIGFIMRDGLAVLAGGLIGTGWIALLATSLALFGPDAFEIILKTLTSLVTP